IAGIVVDGAGQPIAEASVVAAPDMRRGRGMARMDFRLRGFGAQELSDQAGRFVLHGLADGDYRVRASLSGNGRGLGPAGAAGQPVANAGVVCGRRLFGSGNGASSFGGRNGGMGGFLHSTVSDAEGRYVIVGVGVRDLAMQATHETAGASPLVNIPGQAA